MAKNTNEKLNIQEAIKAFSKDDISTAGINLFSVLGYDTSLQAPLDNKTYSEFKENYIDSSPAADRFSEWKALTEQWECIDILFQLTDDSFSNQPQLFDSTFNKLNPQSYLCFAIELKGNEYSKTQIAGITREVNKLFSIPIIIIFKYGECITLSIINRRVNKRDSERDVLEKVTLIKDIFFEKPHSAHIEILFDMNLAQLNKNYTINNFESLHKAWSEVLDTQTLNKRFYAELFAWYEWACEVAKFPAENSKGADVELTKDKNNLQLIRLITRIIFVWFIKHKDLIPTWLFNKNELEQILADCDLNSLDKGNYYNAILQNLFFATLNKKIEERSFANNSNGEKNDNHYGIKTLFRDDNKESFFKIEQNEIIEKFKSVPFLNGGLFECLDCDENDDNNTKHIVRYIDGFSREKERRAFVPNELFWNDEKGLINILNRYNFTVEENTPTDVQVALDPELLGKVFENLLGTYNPETHESARKDSGSFYTPREIVSYMVNSSIKSHLQSKVPDVSEENLERLTNDDKSDDVDIELTQEQIEKIQKALFEIKIIDPACGSGAFPMGILNKLVNIHILLNNLSAKKDTQTNLTIKKGQCINYTPRNSELEIKAEYLGNKNFTLEVNGEKDTLIYDSQKLALHVKEVINQYNKQHDKKTIANLFSQGRIDDNETFNTIKSKREIKRIVDEDTNEIIWQYKTYNVENKFRQYRNDEQTTISDNANEEEDYEHAKDLYNLKLKIIEESIFGVDIQPIAIQICKLRFFISLICEQEKENKPEENYGYPPLPNLETKFVTANALIGIAKLDTKKETFDLFKTDEISNKQKELQEIRHNHFGVKNVDEKIKIRRKDRKLRAELAELLEKTNVFAPEDAMQLANWNPYDQNAVSDFFDTEWMFGVKDGFDIVIGNPPYISAPMQIANPKLAEQRQKLVDSKNYKSLYQKWDIYIVFIELGLQLCKQSGIVTMIVPYPLTNQLYAKVLRRMLVEEYDMFELCDLNGTKIFDNATVSNCIPFIGKTTSKGKSWISNINENWEINRNFEQLHTDLVQDEKTYVWNVTQEKRESNRHANMHVLGDYCYISKGMVLNSDENSKDEKFVKADLIRDKQDSIHCKQYIEGKDLEKWFIKRIRYLEYGTKRSPAKLSRPTFKELYISKKLLINSLGDLKATVDLKSEFYCEQQVRMALLWKDLNGVENKSITSSVKKFSTMNRLEMEKLSKTVDLRYLLGVMNSRYVSILLTNIRGGDYHIVPEHIRNIPIPTATLEQQEPIIDLVDKILAAKKADNTADTSAMEAEIDRLVYALYGLTEEEIKIVEGR